MICAASSFRSLIRLRLPPAAINCTIVLSCGAERSCGPLLDYGATPPPPHAGGGDRGAGLGRKILNIPSACPVGAPMAIGQNNGGAFISFQRTER